LENPGYWIVDPLQNCIIIYTLLDGFYDQVVFYNDQRIIASTFSDLDLTVNQAKNIGIY
jgi:Uma2 family endonuclease